MVNEVPNIVLNQEDIDDRVYGPTREIYVGPYRSQDRIDAEKENMEGDYSDLEVNTFISVAGADSESFWVAKVEKILVRDELNILKTISVLWHAAKDGSDPWKAKYLPEVSNYEKKKGKRGKGLLRPIWLRQEIDLSSLAVFAYNFYLTKSDTLYKKTIDRIKIRLAEFLAEDRDVEGSLRSKEQSAKSVEDNVPVDETRSSDSE